MISKKAIFGICCMSIGLIMIFTEKGRSIAPFLIGFGGGIVLANLGDD